jgi:hypothetical protein
MDKKLYLRLTTPDNDMWVIGTVDNDNVDATLSAATEEIRQTILDSDDQVAISSFCEYKIDFVFLTEEEFKNLPVQ